MFVILGKAVINKNDWVVSCSVFFLFLFFVLCMDSCLRRNDSKVSSSVSYYFKVLKLLSFVIPGNAVINKNDWVVSCSVFFLFLFFVLCVDSCLLRNDSSMFFFEHDHFKDSRISLVCHSCESRNLQKRNKFIIF